MVNEKIILNKLNNLCKKKCKTKITCINKINDIYDYIYITKNGINSNIPEFDFKKYNNNLSYEQMIELCNYFDSVIKYNKYTFNEKIEKLSKTFDKIK